MPAAPGTPPIAVPPGPRESREYLSATPLWTPHQVRGDMPGLSNTGSFRTPTRNPGIMCIIFVHSSWAARRTNQEAPPLLSGRVGCGQRHRRGLRNSPRSDSPRPLSFSGLPSPCPIKAGYPPDYISFPTRPSPSFFSPFSPIGWTALCIPRLLSIGYLVAARYDVGGHSSLRYGVYTFCCILCSLFQDSIEESIK